MAASEVTPKFNIQLAEGSDAPAIAAMARDLVEYGLPWSWTPLRVARHITNPDSTVVIARRGPSLVGFAVMHFRDVEAHLYLLAVAPRHQRAGIGKSLLTWLEKSARVAGIFRIRLEVRTENRGARSFYRKLGYRPGGVIQGYYQGRESALRLSKRLMKRPNLDLKRQVDRLMRSLPKRIHN